MASANWSGGKHKGATDAKAHICHDDKEMRLKHEHNNTHINKELTPYNYSYFGLSYGQKCKKYDEAVAEASGGVRMSSGKNANVTLQEICMHGGLFNLFAGKQDVSVVSGAGQRDDAQTAGRFMQY